MTGTKTSLSRVRSTAWRAAVLGAVCFSALVFASILSADEKEAPAKEEHETHATKPVTNAAPAHIVPEVTPPAVRLPGELPASENLHSEDSLKIDPLEDYQNLLRLGRNLRQEKDWNMADKTLSRLLQSSAPMAIKRETLIELGLIAEESQNLIRAQQVYAQFVKMFPEDLVVPEMYLRQGLIYRKMGAPNLALGKFYAVMSTALNLKQDQQEHYQRLVLRAQTEIADTYYLRGSYQDAADFFKRLLTLNDAALNKPQIAAKLVRALSALQKYEETVAQASEYLQLYPETADVAEVRFLLADALRRLGRNNEATQQVMTLLARQQAHADLQPEVWRYWQQRTGNEIGNQLYKNGDYLNALEIYTRLTELDQAPAWQAPLLYQIGLASEKLEQSAKAAAAYQKILDLSAKLGTNTAPAVLLVVDMARWRVGQIKWTEKSAAQAASVTTNITATAVPPILP